MNRKIFFVIVGVLLFLSSCKTKKLETTGPTPVYDDYEIVQALEDRNKEVWSRSSKSTNDS